MSHVNSYMPRNIMRWMNVLLKYADFKERLRELHKESENFMLMREKKTQIEFEREKDQKKGDLAKENEELWESLILTEESVFLGTREEPISSQN